MKTKKNKKKKKGKGKGGKKDQSEWEGDGIEESTAVSDELTALSSIFGDDCTVAGTPLQVEIKVRRPNIGDDDDDESMDMVVVLVVRLVPGYPFKPAKVQVFGEEELSLSEEKCQKLVSLLQDQASSNARDGRVVIYDLVKATQEFLMSHSHSDSSPSPPPPLPSLPSSPSPSPSPSPPVYGFVDLFTTSSSTTSMPIHAPNITTNKTIDLQKLFLQSQNPKPNPNPNPKPDPNLSSSASSTHSTTPVSEGEKEKVEDEFSFDEEELGVVEQEEDQPASECSSTSSSLSISNTSHMDLIMVYLLHLACAPNGPLSDTLHQVSSELYSLGILSEQAKDLAMEPSSNFNKIFDRAFHKHMVSSKMSPIWKHISDVDAPSTSRPNSRYLNDFEELHSLGHGGFGHVVLCKNKIDGRQYAVKKIRLKDKSIPTDDRILREVATLSRLQHQHVVRYYQAWFENNIVGVDADSTWGSRTAASTSFSFTGAGSMEAIGQETKLESTYLYIQMEYCPRTLRQVFDSYNYFDKELAWHLSRQIVEGLAHIHGQGIIHRDLTPNNIFFDARNDIKIGDFGLAKFLKFEQLEEEGLPVDTSGVSIDGTGQVGTYFYTAPEIEQGWPKIDEKADMYSLGIVFFELWHPFRTGMERHVVLSDLKLKAELPSTWVAEFPEQASLLRRLMSTSPSERPSATELLHHAFPPRMESELLDNILRTMQTSEDSSIYDKVVNAIFDEDALSIKDQHHHSGRFRSLGGGASTILYADKETEARDNITEFSREVFKKHCAKHLEVIPIQLLDGCQQFNRNNVKLLSHGGDMLELCHELRLPFVSWVISSQKSSFKRYEISSVYRRGIGHSPPNRYLQGDFDIIGGTSALTEAEIIKVTMDIVLRFFQSHRCEIHLNHGSLLDAIWTWAGVKAEQRQKVAELLSLMSCLRPQSTKWKSRWVVIRRQLLQELNLPEAVVNRLQAVGMRFCDSADQSLPKLRGALPLDKATRKALDELSTLCGYLRIWGIETHVFVDPLMSPTESYHRDLFFQVYHMRENNSGAHMDGELLAIGGRYDYMLHQMWGQEHKSNAPGAVGTSLALETIIRQPLVDPKPSRNEDGISFLVCSRGGGGMLQERMQLVGELWEENIRAEFVPEPDPSLTEQFEYANEHDLKCLLIIRDTGITHEDSVKVRHLEMKKEKEVERGNLLKFLLDAIAVQFRNPSIWN